MDYIRFCINNPVKVAVGVMLLLLFGLIALFTIPIQLVPNVDQPVITISTNWVGRSPEEVEREIIEEQEDKLKGVTSLRKMTSTASQGRSEIKLEFYVGTDMTRATQEVSDSLREVPEYPDDVDEPVIVVADAASENAIAWMVITSDDPNFEVASLYDAIDKRVKPYLERVDGLSQINIYGGRERQVHVRIDPARLAQRGITFNQLRSALQLENVNVSAGDLRDGRLDIRIRTVGQYDNVDDVRQTIVTYGPGGPIRVGDLGDVELTLEKRRTFVRANGEESMALNAIRATGSNVIAVMEDLRLRIDEVNRDILPQIKPGLKITQVYDETIYIYDALDLVLDNLWQGGLLTVVVLVLFLVSIRPTAIIALAIPTSVVGTFLVMTLFGRNLNVVSIAGLAFAIGMVVDNAIVVLENIDRHLGMGKSPARGAYDGAREVALAVLASTLTTLIVFIPVLTVQEEAGQLFKDISLAICAAVGLSLVVSITVIPSGAARWLKSRQPSEGAVRKSRYNFVARATDALSRRVASLVHWLSGSTIMRMLVVGAFTAVSFIGAYLLMPPTTYLPKGNRNLVFGIMLTPPAYSLEQNQFIADRVENRLRPYWEANTPQEIAQLQPVVDFMTGQTLTPPPIDSYFFVSFGGTIFMGASSGDKENVAPLGTLMSQAMSDIPGAFGFAQQMSLFGMGVGGSNSVDVEISAEDLDMLRNVSQTIYGQLGQRYGYQGVQPDPLNFNMAGPELQVRIDRVRAADLGVDVASLGLGVQALIDGATVGEFRIGGDSIDILMVRDPDSPLTPETLDQVPVAARDHEGNPTVVPLGTIAHIVEAQAPQQIKRVEQLRAVTLTVIPPDNIPLQQTIEDIDALIQGMRASGAIPAHVSVNFAGNADKLIEVREALLGRWYGWNVQSLMSFLQSRFFLAAVINFLLMAALFESFLYPLVIMFSVPLATLGGFLGLRIMHTVDPSQQLDVVTMLGFVILLGTVVNNAILLVAQALNFMRGFGESEEDRVEVMAPRRAIAESVRTRLRPILMTTTTTVAGLLPLVIKPGSGSELYRGLGSVVLGGMVVATVFTLLVVPLLLSLSIDLRIWMARKMGAPHPFGQTELAAANAAQSSDSKQ